MKILYPVYIAMTRYGGIYEGGSWAAFLGVLPVDGGWDGDDCTCAEWWAEPRDSVGVGNSPNEAYASLKAKNPGHGVLSGY